ncbi:hypothetical protein [Pectobacterium parmentieri]|uniref:hypothetical protein n=1 Tax=Pectobacterium parmentieri TaxID=1905730 RepID=UPI000D616E51|nr:hypothetical protein [Pectobacterium parmentieri]PWD58538.1 hypothetical protein DF211_19555 [Pectobacterium parmentieri]
MAKDNPFRVVNDTDPRIEESKQIVKQILSDMIEKVDEEDIETICFVAITSSGDLVYGRHVTNNYIQTIGALERQKYIVQQLLDGVSDISSETQY